MNRVAGGNILTLRAYLGGIFEDGVAVACFSVLLNKTSFILGVPAASTVLVAHKMRYVSPLLMWKVQWREAFCLTFTLTLSSAAVSFSALTETPADKREQIIQLSSNSENTKRLGRAQERLQSSYCSTELRTNLKRLETTKVYRATFLYWLPVSLLVTQNWQQACFPCNHYTRDKRVASVLAALHSKALWSTLVYLTQFYSSCSASRNLSASITFLRWHHVTWVAQSKLKAFCEWLKSVLPPKVNQSKIMIYIQRNNSFVRKQCTHSENIIS